MSAYQQTIAGLPANTVKTAVQRVHKQVSEIQCKNHQKIQSEEQERKQSVTPKRHSGPVPKVDHGIVRRQGGCGTSVNVPKTPSKSVAVLLPPTAPTLGSQTRNQTGNQVDTLALAANLLRPINNHMLEIGSIVEARTFLDVVGVPWQTDDSPRFGLDCKKNLSSDLDPAAQQQSDALKPTIPKAAVLEQDLKD